MESEIQKHIDAIRGEDWNARNEAEAELIRIGELAIPYVVKLLFDDSWIERLFASRVLARTGRPFSKECVALENLIMTEQDDWVRRNAEWAVREIKAKEADSLNRQA